MSNKVINEDDEFNKAVKRFENETHPISAGHFADTGKVSGSMHAALKTFWHSAKKATKIKSHR